MSLSAVSSVTSYFRFYFAYLVHVSMTCNNFSRIRKSKISKRNIYINTCRTIQTLLWVLLLSHMGVLIYMKMAHELFPCTDKRNWYIFYLHACHDDWACVVRAYEGCHDSVSMFPKQIGDLQVCDEEDQTGQRNEAEGGDQ